MGIKREKPWCSSCKTYIDEDVRRFSAGVDDMNIFLCGKCLEDGKLSKVYSEMVWQSQKSKDICEIFLYPSAFYDFIDKNKDTLTKDEIITFVRLYSEQIKENYLDASKVDPFAFYSGKQRRACDPEPAQTAGPNTGLPEAPDCKTS